MEIISDLVKILLPAGAVLYAMYLTLRSVLQRDIAQKALDMKARKMEFVMPLKLQAYERMCLFLERIAPDNLLLRVNDGGFNAATLQQLALAEIRNEFNHNLSQQIYMTDKAWDAVKQSMETLNVLIRSAGSQVAPTDRSVELARKVFDQWTEFKQNPIDQALTIIKAELRKELND